MFLNYTSRKIIQIDWQSPGTGIESQSCLYQHADGTWTVDPESRSLGTSFGEKLIGALAQEFIRSAFTYDDSSALGKSEVARIEGILKKEEMEKEASAHPKSIVIPKTNSMIRVWTAE